MTGQKRIRVVHSIKNELLEKSRESALCAVQVYNNPNITFKSEACIVLMIIAWTYLLHAHCRERNIEYRYFRQAGSRRIFDKTKRGSFKYWELERCLDDATCPLDPVVKSNLKFLIGLRHEIEHQMTSGIDNYVSAKLQACCLNYNSAIKELFGLTISHHQPIALQFFAFSEDQINSLKDKLDVPKNIIAFVADYEGALTDEQKQSPKYSYRIIYVRDNVNHEGQADKAIRFIPEGTEEGKEVQTVLVKNKQYTKLTQSDVVKKMKSQGFTKFTTHAHQSFWQTKWPTASARNRDSSSKKFGELVVNNQWLWYEETWIPVVREYCQATYSAAA